MDKDSAIYVRHMLDAIANIEADIAGSRPSPSRRLGVAHNRGSPYPVGNRPFGLVVGIWS